MRPLDTDTVALKLAEALLLYRGKLSVRDIQALPFLTHPEDAEMIAKYLSAKFKTKICSVKGQEDEVGSWEELISVDT
jgi:hypothetical protein